MAGRRAPRDPSSYAIGFRKPPSGTRFKPGCSGNPRGRPKGSRPIGAVLQNIVQQKIAVTENGKTRKIPVLEVMLRRLANDALRSEPRAMKLMLSLLDRFQDSAETGIDVNAMMAEDVAILQRYLGDGEGSASPADPDALFAPPEPGAEQEASTSCDSRRDAEDDDER